jgi:diguanylate cyclase (GGDEF)-like protein/PAS domain S-box-containing protein
MELSIADKITLLNETTLESLDETNRAEIAKNFTQVGVKILGGDFGFLWFKIRGKYELAYKTPNLPYEPTPPRKRGTNYSVSKYGRPLFMKRAVRKQIGKYDVSAYMKSYVIIPIIYGTRSYGNVVICFKRYNNFSKEDRSLSMALGNATAQALIINGLYADLKDFKHTLDNTLDSIFIFDPKTFKISYTNTGALQQLNLKRNQLNSKPILNLLDKASQVSFREKVAHVVKSKVRSAVFEINFLLKSKEKIPAEIMLKYVASTGQPAHLLGIVRDLSERKKSEERIKHAAFHDALTGLPNRLLFNQHLTALLEEAEREQKKFAVMFLDLDRFKFINDILGHVGGDDLLREAARRLRQSIKKGDFVSRLGGDEFVVLLQNLKQEKDSDLIARRIIEAFQAPFKLGGQEIYVNVSIGISTYPRDGGDAVRLLKNADNALYRVKQEGGNSFKHYHEGIVIPEVNRMELEKHLRRAIKNKELALYYQPIYNIKNRRLVSAEALIRWDHPNMGLILPADFISQAEESGLIVPLGKWIFEQACKQAKIWLKAGHAIPVSVNISPRQLLQQNLTAEVKAILKQYKLPAHLLELELTENFLIQNMDVSIEILKQFRRLGLKVYIDDFGTGYASLNYLKRLPVDFIKIDQSFVHGSGAGLQDAGIIKAIVSLAHHLKLQVVGEGVENPAQAEFLKRAKCDLVQGNFYAKPLSAEKFTRLLEKARP